MRSAMERGKWVFFQNCHLAPSWMPTLERLIENIDSDKVCLKASSNNPSHVAAIFIPLYTASPWSILGWVYQSITKLLHEKHQPSAINEWQFLLDVFSIGSSRFPSLVNQYAESKVSCIHTAEWLKDDSGTSPGDQGQLAQVFHWLQWWLFQLLQEGKYRRNILY